MHGVLFSVHGAVRCVQCSCFSVKCAGFRKTFPAGTSLQVLVVPDFGSEIYDRVKL